MCIEVKNIFPKRAKTDIVCYKLLKEDMTAPYTKFQYDFKEYRANGLSNLLKDIKDSIIRKLRFKESPMYYFYSVGLIHTYKYPPLIVLAKIYKDLNKRVFKCIIPKGTYYYESYASFEDEYASRKLRVVEELSESDFIKTINF